MADRLLHQLPDGDLETALSGLVSVLAWPTATLSEGTDIAAAVRARIEAIPIPRTGGPTTRTGLPGGWRWSWRPARRALVLALVALLAIVAIAGALGLGLPGLRIILGEAPPTLSPTTSIAPSAPSASASATPEALGASLRLGEALDPSDPHALDDRAGFPVRLPTDAQIGPPEAAFIDKLKGGQVTLLWPTRPDLPATLQPDIGLLISEFRGTVGSEFFAKATGANTKVEPVQVDGRDGYWLTGDPHVFFWEGQGGFIDDPRRWVGDVLLWSDGAVTYRLETSLGRDEAIRIAESLR
jgi:hypothetical protein